MITPGDLPRWSREARHGAQKLGTPPRLYNQLVKTISAAKGLTEEQNVRLLTLANVAMADAGIHAWFYKFHYKLWRPVLGIREHTPTFGPGADPGAARLPFSDPFWKPLGAPKTNELTTGGFTPNFPAYPSGHATFGAAVMHITRLYLESIGLATLDSDGRDDVAFDLVSDELNGVSRDVDGSARTRHVRRFSSLLQAIVENSVSRVYLGVHWRFDGTTGGYDPDKADSEGPSAEFNSDEDSLVVPRDSIGGVPLGLDIADAIFNSGLTLSTASLASGVPQGPTPARRSKPLGVPVHPYINEMGWTFSPTNPSGIRVFNGRLVDDRDDVGHYLGVFSQDRLIGGARLCERYQGRFEIHGYQPARDLSFIDKIPNLLEGSRAVIHPEFRESGAFVSLVLGVFEFCRYNRMFIFTIPSVRYVMRFYQKAGMRPVEGCRFKFEPEDPEEAHLFIVDSEAQLSTVIDNLTRLVRGS